MAKLTAKQQRDLVLKGQKKAKKFLTKVKKAKKQKKAGKKK